MLAELPELQFVQRLKLSRSGSVAGPRRVEVELGMRSVVARVRGADVSRSGRDLAGVDRGDHRWELCRALMWTPWGGGKSPETASGRRLARAARAGAAGVDQERCRPAGQGLKEMTASRSGGDLEGGSPAALQEGTPPSFFLALQLVASAVGERAGRACLPRTCV